MEQDQGSCNLGPKAIKHKIKVSQDVNDYVQCVVRHMLKYFNGSGSSCPSSTFRCLSPDMDEIRYEWSLMV